MVDTQGQEQTQRDWQVTGRFWRAGPHGGTREGTGVTRIHHNSCPLGICECDLICNRPLQMRLAKMASSWSRVDPSPAVVLALPFVGSAMLGECSPTEPHPRLDLCSYKKREVWT